MNQTMTTIAIPQDPEKIRQAIAKHVGAQPHEITEEAVEDFSLKLAHYQALLNAPGEPEPFDLARAKAGEPVQMRDGKPWKLVAEINSELPLIGVVTEPDGRQWSNKWYSDGSFVKGYKNPFDLFMAPRPVEHQIVWLNVYPGCPKTKEEADAYADDNRIACIPVAVPVKQQQETKP